jgi:hypothetical protein
MGTKNMVLYHMPCLDGFCAAWMAWRKFGADAEYVPALHGNPPPDVTGKQVYIVDFSYPYDVTLQMLERAERLVILDHHVTAQDDLERIPRSDKVEIVFDMERSGAGLARDYFHPGLESWVVDYTQDRDLWRFALPHSKQVNAYLATIPESFAEFDRVHEQVTSNEAASYGAGAELYKLNYVAKMREHAQRVRFAGHDDIPLVNAPFSAISELVGELAEAALFAVGWSQRGDGKVVFNLRSRGNFDVSELAKEFGGGGHKKAAGFVVDLAVHQHLLEKAGIVPTRPGARLFELVRDVDETGVSGTGKVAEGIHFSDGTLALRWTTHSPSTAVYASLQDAERVHGHGGNTRFVFDGAYKGLVEIPKPHLGFGFEGDHADECIYHNCGPALPGARMAYDKLGKILAPPGWTAHACWCVGGEVHLKLSSPARYLRTESPREGSDYESRVSECWEAAFMITRETIKSIEGFGTLGAKVSAGGVEALSRRIEYSTLHRTKAAGAEATP